MPAFTKHVLVQIHSPFLESYLKRQASLQPDHIAMLDLLWRHYEKSKNFAAASRILAKLADRHRQVDPSFLCRTLDLLSELPSAFLTQNFTLTRSTIDTGRCLAAGWSDGKSEE